jgi:dihydrofolate synthase/folylpolyglutamate synthase
VERPRYSSVLAYLYGQLPMFHRIGKAAYKADLHNTFSLMELLGHPERGSKCVHIAGTNGKGSTSHMIASVLQEAGYRTGLYTSPHLKDFRERIKVNGAMIPEERVIDFVEEHRASFDAISPSFFEWTVALAFAHFRSERTDIAVIETGLGGRLDSTNVVEPEVSVITNIGWDHADLLGGSLEAIAAEKAGIIKPGVPVVVGSVEGTIADVLRAKAHKELTAIRFVDPGTPQPLDLDLEGAYQDHNARTALAAIAALRDRGWRIDPQHERAGLANVKRNTGLRGRWETIAHDPLTIVDVGHNEDGLRAVGQQLQNMTYAHLHVVLGTVADKDIGRMLPQLPRAATYYFCKADLPRALNAADLKERASAAGLTGANYNSVREALNAARSAARPGDIVLVTGSVFVVAEAI